MNRDTRQGIGLLAACTLMFAAPSASAFDWQLHGFAAQGFVLSDGNNFYGNSTQGSFNYYETGLNGSVNLGYGLLVSAQGVVRDAGGTDDGKLRLDYGLLDYQFLDQAQSSAGLRIGRVKNPYGFFNDSRDVVFTRPGILMPQSIYFESAGLRSLLFSSDGAQLYGHLTLGEHELTAEVSAALDRNLSRLEKEQLGGDQLDNVKVKVNELRFARLQDDIDGGRIKLAMSYLRGSIVAGPDPIISGNVDEDMYLVSARYNGSQFSATAEYVTMVSTSHITTFGLAVDDHQIGDGFYVQTDWRFNPSWSVYARYDANFADRSDRSGRDAAAATGASRYRQFALDSSLGISWQLYPHWGVWLEGHLIEGTATVPANDNAGSSLDPHWSLLTAMVGYRF